MPCNIHPIERVLRVLIGAFAVSLAFWGPESVWAYLGLVPLITGVVGYCPPYGLLGINTCKNRTKA
jgi:hypothetical protein